ncbi:hypothetical protein EMCRGX_G013605 [Ephydatia muelleri]
MASELLDELAHEETLRPLLEDKFNAKSFATAAIQSQTIGETLQKLANGIAELDRALYSQVVSNYEDLLSQATGIEALEGVLKMMKTRIESLTSSVDRIGAKVVDPYQKLVSRTDQLVRLQAACDLLRKVIRMLFLIKRLKSQMQGGIREITKVAQTFNEIDQLVQGSDLNGIQVVEDEKPWLARSRKEVEAHAKRMLLQGLELMNPTQVSMALQVFHNLSQLPSTLLTILTGFKDAIQYDIQRALDPTTLSAESAGSSSSSSSFSSSSFSSSSSGPGRATLPTPGTSAAWKAALWTKLEKLVNSIQKTYSQIRQLGVVLDKRRDPLSQMSFMDTVEGTPAHTLLVNFWTIITEQLAVEFAAAAKASTFLNQAFESDYPKLVRVFGDLLTAIEQSSQEGAKQSPYPLTSSKKNDEQISEHETALLKALSPFEKAYLSRSLSRLLDSINQLFTSVSRGPPREDDIITAIKVINSELSSAGGHTTLARVIARNVEKCIKVYNMKCEEMLQTGKEALQVSGPPCPVQLRNQALVNALYSFHKAVTQNVLTQPGLPQGAASVIRGAIQQTIVQMEAMVSIFVNEVQSVMGQMIASMHAESYGGDLKTDSTVGTPDTPCSGYMKELQSFTSRIYAQHMCQYLCADTVHKQLLGVASRVLELLVRHQCLVRPLGEAGKMRLTTDMTQVEVVLSPFCPKIADIGQPYKMLRTMRRLLFLSSEHLLTETTGMGDTLPYSYALSYLFSRAPSDLKSPHQLQGWSEQQYSDWMDKHPNERDRLVFIQATIDTYLAKTKGQGQSKSTPILTVMAELLKRGLGTM